MMFSSPLLEGMLYLSNCVSLYSKPSEKNIDCLEDDDSQLSSPLGKYLSHSF
jgi:hypothetical protein